MNILEANSDTSNLVSVVILIFLEHSVFFSFIYSCTRYPKMKLIRDTFINKDKGSAGVFVSPTPNL